MSIIDRLLTIVVTATITSAAWIVVGSGYVDGAIATSRRPTPATQAVAPPSANPKPASSVSGDAGDLIIPVEGVAPSQLSDTFNDRRGGGERRHEALDIMAPRGTAVIAAAPGKVEKLFKSDAGGNTIYVRSEDRRTIYYYAHLDRYAAGLTEGQTVNRGQPIGFVGSTGDANPVAPHLHFEVVRTSPETKWWEPGTPINPYVLLGGRV